jgi:hypothetical protein
MSKHTPGPWTTSNASPPDYIWDADGEREICRLNDDLPTPEHQANADLIAAAPDLYALVRAWLLSDPHGTHSDACRAAIVKVEGGTP